MHLGDAGADNRTDTYASAVARAGPIARAHAHADADAVFVTPADAVGLASAAAAGVAEVAGRGAGRPAADRGR
eukprot:5139799-Pyramimonas_sp.AAC.1